MTANIIPILGRIEFGPSEPQHRIQHYQDQARLAWFDRMAQCIEDGERIFRQLSSAEDEIAWLEQAREIIKHTEGL